MSAHENISKKVKKVQQPRVDVFAQGGEAAASDGATAQKEKRTKLRNFTLKHQYNILTEASQGNHLNPEGKRIEFQDRNKYGNKGSFFASICNVLNDQKSHTAFHKSNVVETTVRKWLKAAMAKRTDWLTHAFSENFIDHVDFMQDYGHLIDSSDSEREGQSLLLADDKISDDRYIR